MNNLLTALLLSCALASQPAGAASNVSEASAFSALGSVFVVGGSLLTVVASGTVVVDAIERAGESTVVVLKGVSDGARVSLRLSGKAAGNLSVGVGEVVTVTTMASGHVLSVAGQILAFVPNELGKSLLHHSRSGA